MDVELICPKCGDLGDEEVWQSNVVLTCWDLNCGYQTIHPFPLPFDYLRPWLEAHEKGCGTDFPEQTVTCDCIRSSGG